MGAESVPGPFSETGSLGAIWGRWHHGPVFTGSSCNCQCEIYFLPAQTGPQRRVDWCGHTLDSSIKPETYKPETQSYHPVCSPSPPLPSECAERACTQAPGRVRALGSSRGARPAHTHMCQCRAPIPRDTGPPPPSRAAGRLTSPAPSTPRACCLISLNTESHPRVNWFCSSLLYLPLNEETPPIKI